MNKADRSAQTDRQRGRLFDRGKGTHWLLRLRWTRLAATLVAVGIVGYISGAAAVFAIDRYARKIVDARFADVLAPWRWQRLREARGAHCFVTATELVRQQRYPEALMFASKGLEWSPANRDGRLLLADLRLLIRGPQFARPTLLEGLPYHPGDPVFWKSVLTLLLRKQEDRYVVELARQFLPTVSASSEVSHLLSLAAATACFFRGNFDQAEDFLRTKPDLARARDACVLRAKMEWLRGYRELALVQLRELATLFPRDFEINRELISDLRAHGLEDEARRASVAIRLAHPTLPDARIQLLHAYQRAGEVEKVAREIDSMLGDFEYNLRALIALAEFAANCGDAALVRRVADHATAHRMPTEPFPPLEIEAALVSRDYQGAIDAMRISSGDDHPGGRHPELFYSLQAIAHQGLGDLATSRLFLANYLRQPNLRAENLLAVANRFVELDALPPAWQILLQAVTIDPMNQPALARLVELDLVLDRVDELADHIQRLTQMRRPSPDLLRIAAYKLGSDMFVASREAPAALQAVRDALANVTKR